MAATNSTPAVKCRMKVWRSTPAPHRRPGRGWHHYPRGNRDRDGRASGRGENVHLYEVVLAPLCLLAGAGTGGFFNDLAAEVNDQ